MELETQQAAWPLMDTDVRNQITTLLYAMTTLSPRMPIVGMLLSLLEILAPLSLFFSHCRYQGTEKTHRTVVFTAVHNIPGSWMDFLTGS